MTPLRDLLSRLVALDTTSSRSNAPAIDLLASLVKPLGFAVHRQCWADDAGVEKVNLVALSSEAGPPALAFVGHTDCVPFDPAWSKALDLEEQGERLVGRGACDTKGFVACALAAAETIDVASLKRPLALIFTADEEVGCLGARRLAEAKLVLPRFAIIGEPTSLAPVRAHKGYCLAQIEVIGREAHSSRPADGASAIAGAAALVGRIEDLGRTLSHETHADFDPPSTTVNVGRIEGGSAPNIIAGSCRFLLEWRPIPGQPPARLLEAVSAAAVDVARERGLEIRLQVTREEAGLDTPAGVELVRFLERASGRPSTAVAYGTEAPQLATLGAQAVVFGPGDIRDAHRTGESVPVAELGRCAEILREAIRTFCA